MSAELVRGQNHPLTQSRLEIRISTGTAVLVGATLADRRGEVAGASRVAHPGQPELPGVRVPAGMATSHRVAVDLDLLPPGVERLSVLLVLPRGTGARDAPTRFGAVAAPFVAVVGADDTELASYTVTELDAETALVAVEVYRRGDAWKVRAVGQGYAGGLRALLRDQGVAAAVELADAVSDTAVERRRASEDRRPPGGGDVPTDRGATPGEDEGAARPPEAERTDGAAAPVSGQGRRAAPGRIDYRHPRRRASAHATGAADTGGAAEPTAASGSPDGDRRPRPVAGDAPGWSMAERLYNQVWGVFEDLARGAEAYRSAVAFAEDRRERELDAMLAGRSGPAAGDRTGPAAEAARLRAQRRHDELVARARAVLDRDLAQLLAETEAVEPALPPAYARWDSPVWRDHRLPQRAPMAIRMGDLHLADWPELRIPMLVRLPLTRGLWVDSGPSAIDSELWDAGALRHRAAEAAMAHAARLLAVHPAGALSLEMIDPADAAAGPFAPLLRSGVLAQPPARGAQGVRERLTALSRRVDLAQMAVRGDAVDALPPEIDTAGQLLILNDFPHGFDDRAVTLLRYLVDEGPAVGVHVMMVADRREAHQYGPVLDPLWRALLRVTPIPDDHLADPWVGHSWTYEPPLPPADGGVLRRVLAEVVRARSAD